MSAQEIPILNNEYLVVVACGSDTVLRQVLKRYKYPDTDTMTGPVIVGRGVCYHREECHPVVVLPREPQTAEEIGTLAHEATHAVEAIFHYIGQHVGGEVFAHSVGAVVREALKAKKKKK